MNHEIYVIVQGDQHPVTNTTETLGVKKREKKIEVTPRRGIEPRPSAFSEADKRKS